MEDKRIVNKLRQKSYIFPYYNQREKCTFFVLNQALLTLPSLAEINELASRDIVRESEEAVGLGAKNNEGEISF